MFIKILSSFLAIVVFSSCSTRPSLSEKIDSQFKNYSLARITLLNRIEDPRLSFSEKPISRTNWEKLLAPKESQVLTNDDLNLLRRQQDERISLARTNAIQTSLIDLTKVREAQLTPEFCRALPKGGMLHVHPSGTLNSKTVHQLLKSRNPVINLQEILKSIEDAQSGASVEKDEADFLRQFPKNQRFNKLSTSNQSRFEKFLLLPSGRQSFGRFNAVFHFLSIVLPDDSTFEMALRDFTRRAEQEHIIYVELTGHYSPEVSAAVSRIEKTSHVKIRLNRSFNRTESLDELEKKWQKTLLINHDPHLVGIDFLDNEETNSALEKGQLLYGSALSASLQGKTQLHRTMHAGELGDPRNPRDAIILGAERLGHGVLLADDSVTLEYASKLKLPIEMNLSSNLRLSPIKNIQDHPYLKFLRLGLRVSLSTDDEGIFEIDMNHECELAIGQTDVTYYELKQMAFYSIETSFASSDDKSQLLETLKNSFQEFETEWSHKHMNHSAQIN